MKKILLIATILFLCKGSNIQAQRYLPGMCGVDLRMGTTNGKLDSRNFYVSMAMSTYKKKCNRWVVGAELLQKDFIYNNTHVPLAQFTGEAGYYAALFSTPGKSFLLSLGTSVLAGYETINWGEKVLPDGAELENKDSFVFGGALTLSMELYLTDKIILLADARERALWGGTTGNFHTQIGLGIKFIIH